MKILSNCILASLLLFMMLNITGCSCDAEEHHDGIECVPDEKKAGGLSVEEQLDTALNTIRSIKNIAAEEMGENSVALRSLQVIKLGDIWVLNTKGRSKSVESRAGNVFFKLRDTLLENQETISSARLGDQSFEIDWKREFKSGVKTGLTFLNFALSAAFKDESIQRVKIILSIGNPVLHRLREPADVLDRYQAVVADNGVKGDIMVSGIVTGRIRMKYTAFDKDNKEVSLSANVLADEINNFPGVSFGYAESDSVSGSTNVIQESVGNEAVFAASYLTIPEIKQDAEFVLTQISSPLTADTNVTETTMSLVAVSDLLGLPVAEFIITQKRSGIFPNESVEWNLRVRNVDTFSRTIPSMTYTMEVFDNAGRFLFSHEGIVSNLAFGAEESIGVISDDPQILKFSRISIFGPDPIF